MNVFSCIGCGCDDNHACQPVGGDPCHWLRVDYATKVGVCSECREHVAAWDRGDRKPKHNVKWPS